MPVANPGPRLVDTSVWIRADRKGHEDVRGRLTGLLGAGAAWICWPIRAELLIGVKSPENLGALDEQLAALHHASVTDDTWHQAARLGHDLARKGQTVPLADLLIAVAAMDQHLTLWTADSDFKRIATVAPLNLDWFGTE
jgi:predicted nucleic acid-binding protein